MAYGSAALYQMFHRQRPANLTLSTTQHWQQTAADLPERKKLHLAIAMPAALLFFFLPMAAASLGPKRRELHGSARFANNMEIREGVEGDGTRGRASR